MAKQHKLTCVQYMFSIASFIQGSVLRTNFMYPIAKQEAWLVMLMGGVISLPLALIFAQLMKDYHPLSFFDMLKIAFGKICGTAIQGLYVLYFMLRCASHLRYISEFFLETILYMTPVHVIIGCCALLFVWGTAYGVNVAMRYDSSGVLMFFIFFVSSLIMLQPRADYHNLLPVFTLPAKSYVQSFHVILGTLIGDSVILLYLSKYVAPSEKHSPRPYWLAGFGIGILSLFLIVFQDLITLGRMTTIFTLPIYETLRTIVVSPFFNHIELIFIFVAFMLFISKTTTMFYVSLDSFKSLFRQPNKSHFSLLVCAMVVFLAYFMFPSMSDFPYKASNIILLIWTPFSIIIPILLFITLKIRALIQKAGVKPV